MEVGVARFVRSREGTDEEEKEHPRRHDEVINEDIENDHTSTREGVRSATGLDARRETCASARSRSPRFKASSAKAW
jgi:hypothetical protein